LLRSQAAMHGPKYEASDPPWNSGLNAM
jgi:hypothetical protein